jgi:hypothetical protein
MSIYELAKEVRHLTAVNPPKPPAKKPPRPDMARLRAERRGEDTSKFPPRVRRLKDPNRWSQFSIRQSRKAKPWKTQPDKSTS